MSKQCTKPRRKRDAEWFKDKVLLVQAKANGQVLQEEEELEFLADLAKIALVANLSHYGSDNLAEEHASASTPSEKATEGAGGSTTGSQSRQISASADDQPIVQTSQHLEWFSQPRRLPLPDRAWNTALPAAQGDAQSWISDLARQTDARSSFNELLDTPIDFSKFIMHRLNVDTLTPNLLAGPTYELMRGSCTSLTELEYHLEEVYKATTDQLDQSWISDLARQTDDRLSFNELFDTPIDFSNFIMNRLNVDTLTPDLLAGPTYELMRGSCTSLTELEYHLEEVYKATTDQLDYVNPEGQQYPHNLLQPLPLIPDNRGRRVILFDH
nr:hypothetical protein [Tanacetum cinerariifolium]